MHRSLPSNPNMAAKEATAIGFVKFVTMPVMIGKRLSSSEEHGIEAGCDDLSPSLRRRFARRSKGSNAGVVYKDVEPGEPIDRFPDVSFDSLLIADVATVVQQGLGRKSRGGGLQPLLTSAVRGHARALRNKTLCSSGTNARPGPGHNVHLAFESTHVARPSVQIMPFVFFHSFSEGTSSKKPQCSTILSFSARYRSI